MSELEAARRAAISVTSLHTGGCVACAQSIAALDAPDYARQLRDLGVTLVSLPRHSDIILLCGALTEQARASVVALLEGVPRPRALVAVGDCAVNGCVFAGSPQLSVPLAQAFNVHIELGGCPSAPQAIIDAITEARRLLTGAPPRAAVSAPDTLPATEAQTSANSTPPAPDTPDHAARLAALIEAARDGWDDDDEHDELNTDDTRDNNHMMGMRSGATTPTAHHPEEKRR